MARRAVNVQSDEILVLPPFASEAFDVIIMLTDGTSETLKIMARGRVAALRTSLSTLERWPVDRIPLIDTLRVVKP